MKELMILLRGNKNFMALAYIHKYHSDRRNHLIFISSLAQRNQNYLTLSNPVLLYSLSYSISVFPSSLYSFLNQRKIWLWNLPLPIFFPLFNFQLLAEFLFCYRAYLNTCTYAHSYTYVCVCVYTLYSIYALFITSLTSLYY